MSLNILFSFREGIKGLKRARVASVVSISTIAITLILLDLFLIMTIHLEKIIHTFKAQILLEVFVDNTLDQKTIQSLEDSLLQKKGVETIQYISPDMALQRFQNEFGEDPSSFLGENPLPPSFQIKPKAVYRKPDSTDALVAAIEKMSFVDEVVYHGKLFRIVDKYSQTILIIDLGLFFVVLVSSFLLIANTIKLTIFSQIKSVQIMRLIGATKGFINRPYLIQGMVQGGLGGTICSLVVWIIVQLISLRFPLLFHVTQPFFWIPLVFGLLLGFLGSLFGTARFLKR